MTLEAIETETAPNPTASLIVLHGLGADGSDFVPIARELDLSAVGPVRFVFPHAPVMPVTVNGGYRMRAWYDILGPDLARREDEAGLRASLAEVEALIAREKSRGIEASRIVLAGFSQGCAMALLTGLRHAERLGGIVGMSGYLPLAATLARRAQRRQPRRADLPRPRHARPGGAVRARPGHARRAGGARPRRRLARVPDGALGVRRGDRRPRPLAAAARSPARRPEPLSAARAHRRRLPATAHRSDPCPSADSPCCRST